MSEGWVRNPFGGGRCGFADLETRRGNIKRCNWEEKDIKKKGRTEGLNGQDANGEKTKGGKKGVTL